MNPPRDVEPTSRGAAGKETEGEKASATVPKPSVGRLFKNASIYGVAQTLVSLITFVTDPLLSYMLTRADFGLLGLTRTTANLLTSGYRLGLDGAANRLYYDVEADAEAAKRRVLGTLNTFLLGWVVVLSLSQEIFGPAVYARVFNNLPYAPYGRFVAYGLACSTLVAVAQMVWGAQERAKLLSGTRILSALLTSAFMFALLLGTNWGVRAVFWAQAIGPTLLLWVHIRFAWGSFGFAWDTRVVRRALAFGLPLVVHSTSHWALDAADRLMLESYMGRDAVGLYTVAYGTTSTILLVNAAVNSAYTPQFMRTQGKPEFQAFIARSITYFMLTNLAATLGFVIFGPLVIRTLYSARFAEAAPLSPILALSAPFHAVYLIYVNGMFHANRTRLIPVLTFTAGVVNVGLNMVLIPRIGLLGAAIATLAGYGALALLFRLGATTVQPIPLERGRLLRLLFVFCPIALVGVLVEGKLGTGATIGVCLVLTALAPILLYASGFVTPEEQTLVRNSVLSVIKKVRG